MTNGEKLFLILAEGLSFGRAAKRCFLSQQCFSDHIKRLEEYYGTTLLRRPSIN
ncbi:MAG: LysR family transcriptional regulator [Cloacibacillus evryensis]